jgi:hypothetical protein
LRPGLSVVVNVDERQRTGARVDEQNVPVRGHERQSDPVRDAWQ